jgi:hypothetical protein
MADGGGALDLERQQPVAPALGCRGRVGSGIAGRNLDELLPVAH